MVDIEESNRGALGFFTTIENFRRIFAWFDGEVVASNAPFFFVTAIVAVAVLKVVDVVVVLLLVQPE
jgi:hypothetical protein